MTTTVTESGPFERIVRFRLSDRQINEARAGAARKLANDLKIRGFRPGKAPLPVIEAAVGADRVRKEAIDGLVPHLLADALEEEEIDPAVTPELNSLDDADGGVEVEVLVTLWPEIEAPGYKNRNVEVSSPDVTDEDLDEQTTRMLEQFGTVEEVEREAGPGDFITIDVEAHQNGEPVEDTAASDLLYQLGSGLFVEDMDAHVSGVSAGDKVSFEAPLGEGFGDRAGERVTYTITVNEVKERVLPRLDDEWVGENTEFETVDQLNTELRARLADAKLRAVSREYSEKAVSTLREQIEVDLPEALTRAEMDSHLHYFLHRLEDAEITLDDYFQASGITRESFEADLRVRAGLSIRNRLLFEAVAKEEEIVVTEEDTARAIEAYAAQSDDPAASLKAFREDGRKLALAGDILRSRALDAILANANPVDQDGKPVDLTLHMSDVGAEVLDDGFVEGEVVGSEVLEEEE